MTNVERDKDMIESIEMWLHEIEPKWVEKELAWLDELRTRLIEEKSEKPMNQEDLEEAAEEYADKHGFRVPYDGSNNYYDDVDVKASKEGFIAGAEWQKEQMELYGSVTLTESDFDAEKEKASEWGYNLCKEQMINGAVDGEIGYWNQSGLSIRLDKSLEKLGYDEDTKVKIIIVKEDDRPRD